MYEFGFKQLKLPERDDLCCRPSFENPALGSFRLNTLSPAKNMGNDMALVYDTDLDLKDRRVDGHVDLGAFESQILITKYFVDASQNGGSGVYWNDALPDLQKAIYKADKGDSIWVAHGIYLPTSNANRNIAFQIPNGVKIFGGFQGNETETSDLAKRDFKLNETILSGNIGSSGTDTDNSYHVVYIQKADSTTLLNGLTIADGNADQTDTENFFGAGIYNNGQGTDTVSNPTLELCVFKNNKAYRGGGIYNNGKNEGQASPWISHCRFISNTAVEEQGHIIMAQAMPRAMLHFLIVFLKTTLPHLMEPLFTIIPTIVVRPMPL